MAARGVARAALVHPARRRQVRQPIGGRLLRGFHHGQTQRLLRPVRRCHRRHQRLSGRSHRDRARAPRPHRPRLRGSQRHHRRADRGPDRHRQGKRARHRRAAPHAVRRLRLLPLQAQGTRGVPRAVRAADRGVPRARHRLLLLQRRQRLGRHLPQGLADRREAGLPAAGGARPEDRRQRPADHRQLPGLRLGGQVRRGVDARGGVRRRTRWPRPRPRCSCSR